MDKQVEVTVELSARVVRTLERVSAGTGRTIKSLLLELIQRGIDDMDDTLIANQTITRIGSGIETVSGLDEVEKRLGLRSD